MPASKNSKEAGRELMGTSTKSINWGKCTYVYIYTVQKQQCIGAQVHRSMSPRHLQRWELRGKRSNK